jgi:hypothetical protein
MARCLVNEQLEFTEIRPKTWEGLLEALDARLAAERRVVTAVRFDGVDQPSFRDPALGTTSLDGVAQVDIEAEDAVDLLRAAVDAAADSLPELVTGIRLTAAAVRGGAPDAPVQLGALVVALQSLMQLTAAALTAAQMSLGADAPSDAALTEGCTRIAAALERLAVLQTDGRWPAVADALDAHLAPAVAGWSDVLTPIRLRAAA